MISVITGDIIQSRKAENHDLWLNPLRKVLGKVAPSSGDRTIFRGDSFQIRVPAEEALNAALQIKATMKHTGVVDVRMAIAVGEYGADGSVHEEKSTELNRPINESFGTTAIQSGELLEDLKPARQSMMFASGDDHLDRELNLMLMLVLLVLDSWTAASAELALLLLEDRSATQKEIGKRLNIAQSSVSERVKRGSIHEVLAVEEYYRWRLKRFMG